MKNFMSLLLVVATIIAIPAQAGQTCANGVCSSDRDMTWTGKQTFAPRAVAALGTCDSGAKGVFQMVSDGAAGQAVNATISGAGAAFYPVICNGLAWVIAVSQYSFIFTGGSTTGNSAFGQLGAINANEIGVTFGRSALTSGAATIQGVQNGAGPAPLSLNPSGGPVNVGGPLGMSAATWANNQTCSAGQISVDASYIYVCTATNVVKRAALSTF